MDRRRALRLLAGGTIGVPGLALSAGTPIRVDGIVWQVNRATLRPRGSWQRLGARHLLMQWTAVDGQSFVDGAGMPLIGAELPDWYRIAAEPWARAVVLGLAGLHDEVASRRQVAVLAAQSRAVALAAAPLPLRVGGYYFPVEVDPTWQDAAALAPALRQLPRPLWISAYDNANFGARALGDWVARWLPDDVGLYFQDGVGVHARDAGVARSYLTDLTQRFGASRIRVIAEAFRPQADKGFRPATADEFMPQLKAYQGWPIYVFDGPHYLTDELVEALVARGVGAR